MQLLKIKQLKMQSLEMKSRESYHHTCNYSNSVIVYNDSYSDRSVPRTSRNELYFKHNCSPENYFFLSFKLLCNKTNRRQKVAILFLLFLALNNKDNKRKQK